ncbi:MAG: hypothetical protein JWR38_1474, partial [Mucilaginibacter sp.]|nr:hypothetical protein [Mucilaginibacter sp.]
MAISLKSVPIKPILTIKITIMKKINALVLLAVIAIQFGCSKKNQIDDSVSSGDKRTNLKVQASPVGDVVGKVTVGYQGWFAAIGDGSPINIWWHWAPNASQAP